MYKSKLAETLCSLLESCDSSLQLFWGSIIPQIEIIPKSTKGLENQPKKIKKKSKKNQKKSKKNQIKITYI